MSISVRLLAGVAMINVAAILGATGYIAETGRTARTEVNTTAAMEMFQGEGAGHVHTHDHTHEHVHGVPVTGTPLMEIARSQLYNEGLESQIVASEIGRLGLQNEGVETTLRTFAEIQAHAITGKKIYEKMDPVYFVLGMIYQNQQWARVPMIPVENTELAEAFGLDAKAHNRVSSVWVMKTPHVRTMVMSELSGMKSQAAAGLSPAAQKSLRNFAFRLGTFLNLPGELKLVPLAGKPDVWLSPLHLQRPELVADNAPELARDIAALDKTQSPYVDLLELDKVLQQAYMTDDASGVGEQAAAYVAAAESSAGSDYITPLKRKLDYWQTTVHPFKRSAQLFMIAFFSFLFYMALIKRNLKDGDPSDDGGSGRKDGGLVDGRAEEYAARGNENPGVVASALEKLQPQPALAMAGTGPDGAALPAGSGGFTPANAGLSFDNTGARNYDDPITTAALEVPRGSRTVWGISFTFMILATIMLIVALANRAYLGGRMPVSNMYESITFAMGGFAILSLVYEGMYRRGWLGVGACMAGWILMTMANSMPLHARKVDPLVAVLNSVWLNFHVTALLISYSCFLLAFVTGILFLIKDSTGNRAGVLPRAETFEYLTYRCVQIGWPLLTLGIFLGAVWANTAWGSFWSWDPKETWALITWFTYTIYLHLRINLGWNGRRSVIASMIGFVMVLVTYFGVSYLPGLAGGMHSYAEPIQR